MWSTSLLFVYKRFLLPGNTNNFAVQSSSPVPYIYTLNYSQTVGRCPININCCPASYLQNFSGLLYFVIMLISSPYFLLHVEDFRVSLMKTIKRRAFLLSSKSSIKIH